MTTLNDRREFSRLAIPLEAELHLRQSDVITGEVCSISLSSCFVECVPAPNVENEGTLKLFFPGRQEEMQIEASVRVIRAEPTGAVIEFLHIALEGYHHLRYLLMSNAEDDGAMEDEVVSHAGIRRGMSTR